MGFLERLRAYLDRVACAPEGLPAVSIDLAAHRRHFATERDRLGESVPRWQASNIQELGERLPAFVEDVAERIRETLAPEVSPEELADLINVAISQELRLARTSGSRGRDEELGRISSKVRAGLKRDLAEDGWRLPSRYAFEIRATRRRGDRHVLTRSGAAFLELPGIDAVRWLLALEAAQTLGPADAWRISPELANQLLKEPDRSFDIHELIAHAARAWPYSWATVRRLDAMQIVHYTGRDGIGDSWGYTVFERARPLLEEIAEQRPTPFAVLASALLQDEVARTLDGVRPDPERAFRESAASATALQARMVVHEIRNALIPAQGALSRLARELGDATQAELLHRHLNRVDAGIQRALAFADEMLRVANLGVEPAAPFDAAAAVRDAIAGVSAELNGSLRYNPPEGAPSVVGPRARFVLAVINLLRNAAQAVAGREGIVEVSMEAHEERIVLRVDDSGSGVPPEQRRAIFDPGVALRPGGSGQGLALVRQVVEGEMGGAVTCGDSPLGGACFEIVIPAREARGR